MYNTSRSILASRGFVMSETLLPSNASPHVAQFTADYMFVREQLDTRGINTTVDTGMGDADLALSIVNDAYNHDRATRVTVQKKVEEVEWEQTKRELGIDD